MAGPQANLILISDSVRFILYLIVISQPVCLLSDKIQITMNADLCLSCASTAQSFRRQTGKGRVGCVSAAVYLFYILTQKRRRRIDRSMIGEPTNFVHTTHVGSGDMGLGLASVSFMSSLQNIQPKEYSKCDFSELTFCTLMFVGGPCSGPDEI